MRFLFTATVIVAFVGNSIALGSKMKLQAFKYAASSNPAFNFRKGLPDESTQGNKPEGLDVMPPQNPQSNLNQDPLSTTSQNPQRNPTENPQFSSSEKPQGISPQNPSEILQTYPSNIPQRTPAESPHNIPTQGSQNIPTQGSQSIPNQGSQSIQNQGSQSIPNQGSQSIPNQGSQSIPNQGSQSIPNQGSQSIPNQGSQSIPNQGSQSIPIQGPQNIPNQGSQNMPTQGSQSIPNQGSQSMPTQGSQSIPNQGSQSIPNQGSQSIPNQGSQSIPIQGSQSIPQQTPQTIPSQSPQRTPSESPNQIPNQGTQGSPNIPPPSPQRQPSESPEALLEMQQTRPPVSGQHLPTPKPVISLTDQQLPNGDEEVQIQDVPYQLGLEIEGVRLCAASVIGEHWALTSAYCTHGPPSSKKTIRLRSKIGVHRALHITVYPSTRASNSAPHDIAVVLVTPPFAPDTALSLPERAPKAGTQAVLTGWGRPECLGPGPCLQTQHIPVVDRSVCKYMYEKAGMEVGEGMLCAGNLGHGKGACIGDPGGPLVVGKEVVGIVSWGKDCSSEYPGVYTDVAQYRGWVTEVMDSEDA